MVLVLGWAFPAKGSKDRQGDRSVVIGPKCSIRDPEAEPKIFLESTDGYGMSWYSSTFHIFAVPGPRFFKIFDLGPWIPVSHIQNSMNQTTRRKPPRGQAVANLKSGWYQTVDRCLENGSYHVSHIV